jgi:hypothetical protein
MKTIVGLFQAKEDALSSLGELTNWVKVKEDQPWPFEILCCMPKMKPPCAKKASRLGL